MTWLHLVSNIRHQNRVVEFLERVDFNYVTWIMSQKIHIITSLYFKDFWRVKRLQLRPKHLFSKSPLGRTLQFKRTGHLEWIGRLGWTWRVGSQKMPNVEWQLHWPHYLFDSTVFIFISSKFHQSERWICFCLFGY